MQRRAVALRVVDVARDDHAAATLLRDSTVRVVAVATPARRLRLEDAAYAVARVDGRLPWIVRSVRGGSGIRLSAVAIAPSGAHRVATTQLNRCLPAGVIGIDTVRFA